MSPSQPRPQEAPGRLGLPEEEEEGHRRRLPEEEAEGHRRHLPEEEAGAGPTGAEHHQLRPLPRTLLQRKGYWPAHPEEDREGRRAEAQPWQSAGEGLGLQALWRRDGTLGRPPRGPQERERGSPLPGPRTTTWGSGGKARNRPALPQAARRKGTSKPALKGTSGTNPEMARARLKRPSII